MEALRNSFKKQFEFKFGVKYFIEPSTEKSKLRIFNYICSQKF